ncbi:Ras-related protein Rac [Acrasis kona]|uniref:Ras-related protein Rac n=1 Tax=Acrasis kona TaxID=1008807 RepID=A0AAW2ZGI7_9EUKA
MSNHEEEEDTENIKCVVVGDGAVGKTCLLLSYSKNEFPSNYVPTICDNYNSNVTYKDNLVSLSLWDTAGQEEYDQLRPLSYGDTNVFLVCFSVINPDSWQNVKSKWVPELRKHMADTPIVLVGTKIDLRNDSETLKKLTNNGHQPYKTEQGTQFKNEIGAAAYKECSARTMEGLNDVFTSVIETHYQCGKTLTPMERKAGQKKKCTMM